ncbi:hypothetical protein [Paenibacillus glufosinatiresistens]|uniref:hypothetical protein n=1 Tax=Paenibacillus glufosinatiresistens TaxID=3070657 RepID=UPI00286E3E5A|nr:hypothetical protein [Paenibacillus sp. YX.27]
MKADPMPRESGVLRVLDRLAPLLIRMGADYPVMRSIVGVKLTMDGRRTPTVLGGTAKESPLSSRTGIIQWIYVLYGAMFALMLMLPLSDWILAAMQFGVLTFFMMTTLISDFSSVLLDLRDKSILLSRPVDGRTLGLAKTVHILVYLLGLSLSLAGPGLLVALFYKGVAFFLLFLAGVLLTDMLVLVLTGLFYLLIMKLFDGEKLKDMINYVQIGLSVTVIVGYQFLSRMFNMTVAADMTPRFAWWEVLIPPVWFGSAFEVVLGGERRLPFVLMAIAALAVPVVLCIVYIRTLPAFERSLAKLASQESAGGRKSRYADLLARLFCRGREERLFFGFCWSMMRQERDFKLKVYPTIGLSVVFPFIFMANTLVSGNISALRGTKAYLYIYLMIALIQTVVTMLAYSINYKAAWVYRAVPLTSPERIYSAVFKAALARLIVPLYLLEAAVFLLIFGPGIWPDLLAVLLTMFLYTVICYAVQPRSLPFSEKYERNRQKEKQKGALLLLLILLGLAGAHYLVRQTEWGIYFYLALLAAAGPAAWRIAFGPAKSKFRFPSSGRRSLSK